MIKILNTGCRTSVSIGIVEMITLCSYCEIRSMNIFVIYEAKVSFICFAIGFTLHTLLMKSSKLIHIRDLRMMLALLIAEKMC